MIVTMVALLMSAGQAESPDAGATDNKVICRSQPQVGTRLRTKKLCKTKAEWRAMDADREQLRRDLGNSARGPNE
jgi:hypothetical protein